MASNQATDYPSCGTRFGRRTCITTNASPAWCMLLHEEPQAVNVLPPILHILCVHGQHLTSLGHIQYTSLLFIQSSEHTSSGTQFGENCKTTKPSSRLSMLLSAEPQAMNVLPSIWYVWWEHGQGLTNLGQNEYLHRGAVNTRPQTSQAVGPEDLVRIAKQPYHPQVGLCCYTKTSMILIDYQVFHIYCGCMVKVFQAWDMINTYTSILFIQA